MNAIHDGLDVAPERLSAIDLNLLVAFDAIARERSVTRAATRVGLTQSAMSHALRRLRDLLDDPVLVRGRSGMALTPRAESLVVPLRSGLVTLGRALARPAAFEPRTSKRAFTIASPDLFDVLAMPPLLEQVGKIAPGVDIAIVPVDGRRLADQLETGEIDVAIVPRVDRPAGAPPEEQQMPSQGLVRHKLFRDRFACLIRAGHPALGAKRRAKGGATPRLSLDTFVELSHVLISPTGEGRGFVDAALERQGLRRRIALRMPHFYSALAIVSKSDLILTAPTALAGLATPDHAIVAVPAPIQLPEHSVHLVWHERFSNDPGHAWLRGLVTSVSRGAHQG